MINKDEKCMLKIQGQGLEGQLTPSLTDSSPLTVFKNKIKNLQNRFKSQNVIQDDSCISLNKSLNLSKNLLNLNKLNEFSNEYEKKFIDMKKEWFKK